MTREAFGQAYGEGLQYTVRFLLSRGVPRDSAEDVAQSAWMRGWERLSQLRDHRMVFTWINTIALNHYRRSIRHDRLREDLQEPLYFKETMNWAAIDLSKILQFCRPIDRFLLKAQMEGSTAKEIAEEQGVSHTAIRIRMLRARRAARKIAEGRARRMIQPAA
jgi:RNA polymerase sigma factor (sigma-70 family)